MANAVYTAMIALGSTIDGVPSGEYKLPQLLTKVFNKMDKMEKDMPRLAQAQSRNDVVFERALYYIMIIEKLDKALGNAAVKEERAAKQRKYQRKSITYSSN
jgi:hypothetical protein